MIDEDHYIYMKRSIDKFIIMLLYADNIIIANNSNEYVKEIKEMGEATYILKVKILKDHLKKLLSLS